MCGWPPILLVFIQLLWLCWIDNRFGRIQTSQTGGQQYSDTSPYEVSECSLPNIWRYLPESLGKETTRCLRRQVPIPRPSALPRFLQKIKWFKTSNPSKSFKTGLISWVFLIEHTNYFVGLWKRLRWCFPKTKTIVQMKPFI